MLTYLSFIQIQEYNINFNIFMEEETHEDKVPRALESHNMALPYLSEMSCRGKGENISYILLTFLSLTPGSSHSIWPSKQNGEKVSWILALRF